MACADELVLAINEIAWMVAKTGKPIYTLDLSSEDVPALIILQTREPFLKAA